MHFECVIVSSRLILPYVNNAYSAFKMLLMQTAHGFQVLIKADQFEQIFAHILCFPAYCTSSEQQQDTLGHHLCHQLEDPLLPIHIIVIFMTISTLNSNIKNNTFLLVTENYEIMSPIYTFRRDKLPSLNLLLNPLKVRLHTQK